MSWVERIARNEGSTLVAGLMRIGVVLLLWSRYAWEVHPMRHRDDPEWLVIAVLFYALTLFMGIGLFSRISSALVALLVLYMYFGVGVHGGYDDWAHHHTYTLMSVTVLTAFTPNGRSLSLDRWLALRRGDAEPEHGDLWALRLVAWQCSMVYLWGAYQKTSEAYLSGDRLEQIAGFLYLGSDFPEGPALPIFMMVSGILSVLLEYGLAVLPWFRRTRVPILVLGCLFHGVIYWTMPVATFSLTMALMYLAYFPPDEIDALARRLRS